jgi:hypothetical protein
MLWARGFLVVKIGRSGGGLGEEVDALRVCMILSWGKLSDCGKNEPVYVPFAQVQGGMLQIDDS